MADLQMIGGLWAPPAESEKLSTYPLFDGRLDLDVTKVALAASMCKRRRRALDVGAHIGAGSVYLADKFKDVDAFEPMAPTRAALEKNVSGFSNVRVHASAVSDRAEELVFEFVAKSSQLSRALVAGGEKAFKSGQIVNGIQSICIDDLDLMHVDFIKLDVEGLESRVVRGAMKTIGKWKPVILIEQGGNEEKFLGEPANAASLLLEDAGMVRVDGLKYKNDRIYVWP